MAQEQNVPSYSEQEQIRRDKLSALREAGHDPYLLTKVPVDTRSKTLLAAVANVYANLSAEAGNEID